MTGWSPEAPSAGLEVLSAPPALAPLYVRAVTARSRRSTELRPSTLRLPDVTIDRTRLQSYQQVCGYRTSDVLPPAFPHLLGFALSMERMTRPDFPFPLLGLVHIRNTISQSRPLTASERFEVTVWADGLADHRAGKQIELHTEVSAAGEVVWREVSAYLHRSKSSDAKPAGEGREQRPEQPEADAGVVGVPAQIEVPGDVGRAYAAVSGDRNPIHLSDLSARVFGFKKAIAHGMWLAARAAAHYEGRLPEAFCYDVSFRAPLFLPGKVLLASTPKPGGWELAVTGRKSGRTHLSGSISQV